MTIGHPVVDFLDFAFAHIYRTKFIFNSQQYFSFPSGISNVVIIWGGSWLSAETENEYEYYYTHFMWYTICKRRFFSTFTLGLFINKPMTYSCSVRRPMSSSNHNVIQVKPQPLPRLDWRWKLTLITNVEKYDLDFQSKIWIKQGEQIFSGMVS